MFVYEQEVVETLVNQKCKYSIVKIAVVFVLTIFITLSDANFITG